MKATHQIEFQTLALLDALANGQPGVHPTDEEAHFASWPGPPRAAARILAAQANAARGRDLLWVIGVRQPAAGPEAKTGLRVTGAKIEHFDAWLHQLLPYFDGIAPQVQAFSVSYGQAGKTPARQVVALQIKTVRAPFVTCKDERGSTREVLWRDAGTGHARSAAREELVRLLVPLQDLPQFEVLEAELTFYKNLHPGGSQKTLHRWTLDGSIYVIPQGDTRTVIPLHRCSGGIHIPDSAFSARAQDLNLTADKLSPAVRITESAALIEGLGRIFIYCCGSTAAPEIPWQKPLTVAFDLVPAGADRAAIAAASLHPEPVTESNQAGRWKL